MYFENLKKVVSKISNMVKEVEKKYKTTGNNTHLSQQEALRKVQNLQEDIVSAKVATEELRTSLVRFNNKNEEYLRHVKNLVTEMEDKLISLEDFLKKFGYQPLSQKVLDVETTKPCTATEHLDHMHENGSCEDETYKLGPSVIKTPTLVLSSGLIIESSQCSSAYKTLHIRTPVSSVRPMHIHTRSLKQQLSESTENQHIEQQTPKVFSQNSSPRTPEPPEFVASTLRF